MADNFDAVEIIYSLISGIGIDVYKDKAPRDVSGEYVVVNSPSCNPGNASQSVNIVQANVNIFIPSPAEGMVNRARLKELRTSIYSAIDGAEVEDYYCWIDRSFSATVEDAREGYDCFTIRYELTLNT